MKRFPVIPWRKISTPTIILLLLLNTAMVVAASPWDGVPDDVVAAQSIWVDPGNSAELNLDDIFTIDVLINVTSPTAPGGGNGLFGFEYKLSWNTTILDVMEIQTHTDNVPPGDLLTGWTMIFLASNDTSTPGVHQYALSAVMGSAWTGVESLCTYKFKVMLEPEGPDPELSDVIQLYDDILVDDTATPITHTTVDGEIHVIPEFLLAMILPLFIVTALVAAILGKRRLSQRRDGTPLLPSGT